MVIEKAVRKSPRLKEFDYASSRYYFVTVCTKEHQCHFGSVIATQDNGEMRLNENGMLLERHVKVLDQRYPFVSVDQYVIMPNHIHLIILLDHQNLRSLPQIIGSFKSGVSRELGFSVWQRSFNDHVIRGEEDYRKIWEYIENNPAKWAMDKYYQSS